MEIDTDQMEVDLDGMAPIIEETAMAHPGVMLLDKAVGQIQETEMCMDLAKALSLVQTNKAFPEQARPDQTQVVLAWMVMVLTAQDTRQVLMEATMAAMDLFEEAGLCRV